MPSRERQPARWRPVASHPHAFRTSSRVQNPDPAGPPRAPLPLRSGTFKSRQRRCRDDPARSGSSLGARYFWERVGDGMGCRQAMAKDTRDSSSYPSKRHTANEGEIEGHVRYRAHEASSSATARARTLARVSGIPSASSAARARCCRRTRCPSSASIGTSNSVRSKATAATTSGVAASHQGPASATRIGLRVVGSTATSSTAADQSVSGYPRSITARRWALRSAVAVHRPDARP